MEGNNTSRSMIISDYFQRDMHEKNAAGIGMALSKLDQDDVFQFTQRILMESKKYDTDNINRYRSEIEKLFFGNGKSNLPDQSDDYIPLYFLKAEKINSETVKIRGIKDGTNLKYKLHWSVWQSYKRKTTMKIFNVAASLIIEINEANNFSNHLKTYIDDINELRKLLDQSIDKEPEELVNTQYIDLDDDDRRSFSSDIDDFMTYKGDSSDPAKRKFKTYSRDYFYNLRHFVSQAFNATEFHERMFHLATVANFVSNKMYTKSRNQLFVIEPTDREVLTTFVRLVYDTSFFNEVSTNHQYLTTDERLAIRSTLSKSKSSLMIAGTKIMSLVNYILTVIPYQKKNTMWEDAEI